VKDRLAARNSLRYADHAHVVNRVRMYALKGSATRFVGRLRRPVSAVAPRSHATETSVATAGDPQVLFIHPRWSAHCKGSVGRAPPYDLCFASSDFCFILWVARSRKAPCGGHDNAFQVEACFKDWRGAPGASRRVAGPRKTPGLRGPKRPA